ncbi:uncharacterized protein LOC110117188 [Athalia rosae]|uniref:uncharacterized protein LOC110117188 n=1 Tax=Athalia rosae TaxID=37344 RepID=UPI00203472E2|nr:uncharacterized protein LOC110117188 [Athalia rosae]
MLKRSIANVRFGILLAVDPSFPEQRQYRCDSRGGNVVRSVIDGSAYILGEEKEEAIEERKRKDIHRDDYRAMESNRDINESFRRLTTLIHPVLVKMMDLQHLRRATSLFAEVAVPPTL